MIELGKVRVNGRVAQIGDLVSRTDRVLVNGNQIEMRSAHVYLAFNKPVGVTTTTDRTDPDNILKALAYHGGRVFPVGRLDKDSEGLILFTDDGDIVNKILRASNKHDKEYTVSVDKPVTDEFVRQMSEGVSILGVMTRRCVVEKISSHTFRIVLNQGLNRQIRRMCQALGYEVTRLQRVRVMHISLTGIETGTWRFLTDKETETLLKALESSRKEAAPRPARKRRVSATGKPKAGSGDDSGSDSKSDAASGQSGDKRASKKSGAASSTSAPRRTASGKPQSGPTRTDAKPGASQKKGDRKTPGTATSGSARPARKPKPGGGTRNAPKPKGRNTRKGKSPRSGKR